MNPLQPKADLRLEKRILMIVDLGLRRDRILERRDLDLDALAALAADYEAADLLAGAADLQRRLEMYRRAE